MTHQFYRDPIGALVAGLQRSGVVFEIKNGTLRWRAPNGLVTSEAARRLADYAAIVAAILNPDTTLPDLLIIPPDCHNSVPSLRACIDAQRIGRERCKALGEAERGSLSNRF